MSGSRGPIERAVRAELAGVKIAPAKRGLAASAVALAARADDLPDAPASVLCPSCVVNVQLPPELLRTSPADLARLLAELRATLVKLTEGSAGDGPLAALAAQLAATAPGGPPVGHPEAR